MALEGFLQEFGLADILQLIYFQKKTGVLHIEGRADKIKLYFINGNVILLESKKRTETNRLGKVLARKGLLTQEELATALETHSTEGIKLGSFVVRRGFVSKEDVIEVIQEQIVEAIVQMFTWKEGRYEFIPQEVQEDKDFGISLDTQHLLMGGVRIVDELSVIDGKLDLDAIYRRTEEPDRQELSTIEYEVLQLIDGETDVSTVMHISHFEDYETSKAIVSLEEKGLIAHVAIPVREREKAKAPKRLDGFFYGSILLIFGIVSIFLLKGNYDAFQAFRDARISMAAERLRNDIEVFYIQNGRYPETLDSIAALSDVWGSPYEYRASDSGFSLFSRGPDGIRGTEDDVY